MKILVTHVFGFQNKGDWALFDSLLNSIYEKYPKCGVHGVCRDPISQKVYFPSVQWHKQLGTSYKKGFARKIENVLGLLFPYASILLPHFLIKKLAFLIDIYNTIDQSDLCICCPGGYLEDSNTSILTNYIHIILPLKFKKQVILAPQSIGPLRSNIWRFLLRNALNKCKFICVREEFSKQLLSEMRVEKSKTFLMLDMAFYFNRITDFDLSKYKIDRKFIAMTCIDWYFPFSSNPLESKKIYKNKIINLINFFYTKYGFKTILLKQIETSSGINGDDLILSEIHSQCKDQSIYLNKDIQPSEMKYVIRSSELFIGSRMHSNIFALQNKVNVVALAYLPKTTYIMKSLGLNDYSFDIETFSIEDIDRAYIQLTTSSFYSQAVNSLDNLVIKNKKHFFELI